jgi:uncharacterized membrane protein HdeD (DUF308 family)
MNIIVKILILFVGGYMIGIILNQNFVVGIFLLLIGIFCFIWSLYKKKGHFKRGDKISTFLMLVFIGLIGLNLAIFNIPKLEDHYKLPLLLLMLFIYAIVVSISETWPYLKSKKFK